MAHGDTAWGSHQSDFARIGRSTESARRLFEERELRKQNEQIQGQLREKAELIDAPLQAAIAAAQAADDALEESDESDYLRLKKDSARAAAQVAKLVFRTGAQKVALYTPLLGHENRFTAKAAETQSQAVQNQLQQAQQFFIEQEKVDATESATEQRGRGDIMRDEADAAGRQVEYAKLQQAEDQFNSLHKGDKIAEFGKAVGYARAARSQGQTDEEIMSVVSEYLPEGGTLEMLYDRSEGISQEFKDERRELEARIGRAEKDKKDESQPDDSNLRRLKVRLEEVKKLDDAQYRRDQEWDDYEMDNGAAQRKMAEFTANIGESLKNTIKFAIKRQFGVPGKTPSVSPVAGQVRAGAEKKVGY